MKWKTKKIHGFSYDKSIAIFEAPMWINLEFHLKSSHITRITGTLMTILVAPQEVFEKESASKNWEKKDIRWFAIKLVHYSFFFGVRYFDKPPIILFSQFSNAGCFSNSSWNATKFEKIERFYLDFLLHIM